MKELIEIQNKLNAPKGQFNSFGKYKYRSAEDILTALKPLLYAQGCTLILSDEVVSIGNRIYVRACATIQKENAEASAYGYAREEETKKGMDTSQITGMASSYARKYAMNGLFAIDDQKDSDSTNDHGKAANDVLLPELKEGTPEYAKVVAAYAKGYTMDDVRKKFNVSSEIEMAIISSL
jgi:hypothetical protein